mgnify:CR=1 FL=1|tara:strand:+ start:736 stop:4485 length:3750 start_codon:yes stop_codon:yes gene_type:complete
MGVSEEGSDDRIIREREFKRSSGIDIIEFSYEKKPEVKKEHEKEDEAIGNLFDPFADDKTEEDGDSKSVGTSRASDSDIVTSLSARGDMRINWILMVSLVVVYTGISIRIGMTFAPITGTIALLVLAILGFSLAERWIPNPEMRVLGVTWAIISMKVLYGLAIELRQWELIGSDWTLGFVLLTLVCLNIYAAYRYDQDAIAAQSTLVLLAIGSTAGSVLGEIGVAGMILLASAILHYIAINRNSGNLASLGIAASNLWIGMHAITFEFEIAKLHVLPLDSPLLLFLLLMATTALNASMAARFAREENWFSKAFETIGIGRPGLWGVSISLGMIGAVLAVAANKEDIGYAMGMVTFLGGAFGGSYLVVRGVEARRVAIPLLASSSFLVPILLFGARLEEISGFSSYEIFAFLGALSTGFVILRDQDSVTDRVLWMGSVTILALLVVLIPAKSVESGGDGGAFLLSLLAGLHICTSILAFRRESASLSGVTVLLPWSWLLLEEMLQEVVRTLFIANDASDPGTMIYLDPRILAVYLSVSLILLLIVNTKMGDSGVNLASGFLGVSELSAAIRDSGVLKLWGLGLWIPIATAVFLAQFGGFTAQTILFVLSIFAIVHISSLILGYREGSTKSIMGAIGVAILVIQWRHGLDEALLALLCASISVIVLFDSDEDDSISLGIIFVALSILISTTGRIPSLSLEGSSSLPELGLSNVSLVSAFVIVGVFLAKSEKMERMVKSAFASLGLIVLSILVSFRSDSMALEISSISLFIVTSFWLITRAELRSELRSMAKKRSIVGSIENADGILAIQSGSLGSYVPKIAEMRELRKSKREKDDTDDIGELLASDITHRPIVGLAVLFVVLSSAIIGGSLIGSDRDLWPLFLAAHGVFAAFVVILIRGRTRGLDLDLPHLFGIEMPIAMCISGFSLSFVSAHIIPAGSSKFELLDMAVLSIIILSMVVISLINQTNLIERISISIDWFIGAFFFSRLFGSIIGEALPLPLSIDPSSGDLLEWEFPLYLLETLLFGFALVSFWIEEKRMQIGRARNRNGLLIGLRCLAIVSLSFGPAGLVAAALACYQTWKSSQPTGFGWSFIGVVLSLVSISSWVIEVEELLPEVVLISGIVLILSCALTIPLDGAKWTMTLATDAHLLTIAGAIAMAFRSDSGVPVLLILSIFVLMSTIIWIAGILQYRKSLRIWGLIDLVVGILCILVLAPENLLESANLLIAMLIIAIELGIISWLGVSKQRELSMD